MIDIDLSTLYISAGVYVIAPFLPDVYIGGVSGNLRDGVKLEVGVSGVASGSITFHLLNSWELWANVELWTFIASINKDIWLLNIP